MGPFTDRYTTPRLSTIFMISVYSMMSSSLLSLSAVYACFCQLQRMVGRQGEEPWSLTRHTCACPQMSWASPGELSPWAQLCSFVCGNPYSCFTPSHTLHMHTLTHTLPTLLTLLSFFSLINVTNKNYKFRSHDTSSCFSLPTSWVVTDDIRKC